MTDRLVTTLGDLLRRDGGSIKTGPFGTTLKAAEYSEEGVPLISVGEVGHGHLRVRADTPRAPKEVVERLPEYILQEGDIVFGRKGAVDRSAWVKPEQAGWFLGSDGVRVRLPLTCDSRFVAYQLQAVSTRTWIRQHATGTTMASLNQTILGRLPIVVLPLMEQRRIAGTLAALDDKLESNRRLIEKLQHLSAACFRAWRSSCTDIVATTFGDFCDVYGGSTPRTDEPSNWGGPHCWATPTDLTALPAPYLFSTFRTVSDHGLKSCSAALHPPGTIFMTSRATIGAFAVNQEACATNQGFICARPRHDRDRWFLFEEMRMRVPEMLDRANGSTFLELSRRNFKAMTVQVGSEKDRDRLRDEVEPLHRLAAQRSQESRGLAELRDALLPELLSGRIWVPEAGEAVESALA